MNILRVLSVLAHYVLHIVHEVMKKVGLSSLSERSFMPPIWVRYGIGCDWEFAEYWIFRALHIVNAHAGTSSAVRCERQ
jgi:hypothetical protein